ncbi:MAG: nucleoside phosphorylase [Bacteroidota bacterium]
MLRQRKDYQEASLFQPKNLLREARRQKTIPEGKIPPVCVLDPDGDIVDYLLRTEQAIQNPYWACYHSQMVEFANGETKVGMIGNAVGASYAVLLAEQMFVSGCELLLSITSAGMICPPDEDQRFVLINKTLRDEGTSYHYLPAEEPSTIQADLLEQLLPLTTIDELGVMIGDSWTTDAPYRETKSAIDYARQKGVTAVEMEASALYAFAKARNKYVVCFAHLTNTMAQDGEDFEKGVENGSIDALRLISRTIKLLRQARFTR